MAIPTLLQSFNLRTLAAACSCTPQQSGGRSGRRVDAVSVWQLGTKEAKCSHRRCILLYHESILEKDAFPVRYRIAEQNEHNALKN